MSGMGKDAIDVDIGIFQRLLKDGIPQKSNHPDSLNVHADFLKRATGRILISGLGLGESLHEVLKKPDVTFVRIIEIDPNR